MPFPMKIQPVDIDLLDRFDTAKPVLKSRFKRLFDRQFPSVLRTTSADKPSAVGGEAQYHNRDGGGTATIEFEPSSVCLAKMVQNFIEDSTEKIPVSTKCGRNRCNCFNGNINDSSDDEFDVFGGFGESIKSGSFNDPWDVLKSLIPCSSVAEKNLLADTSKIVEKNKNNKRKEDLINIVNDGLSFLGYNSSICKSKWDKTPSFPAGNFLVWDSGEYEYIDVIVEGERLLIDIDFRSEFEIARSTGTYKNILQSTPYIFVGKSDRLQQIVSIVSEAANQSFKKKGMPIPPWRKVDYMRAKWLSPNCTKTTPSIINDTVLELKTPKIDFGELEPALPPKEEVVDVVAVEVAPPWEPPAVRPKSVVKVVTGLASLLKEKPSNF